MGVGSKKRGIIGVGYKRNIVLSGSIYGFIFSFDEKGMNGLRLSPTYEGSR